LVAPANRFAAETASAELAAWPSAVAGGLLARMIHVSRGRFDLFNNVKDGTYQRNGRSSDFDARGLRLKEWV
jgi:hypothetical protein